MSSVMVSAMKKISLREEKCAGPNFVMSAPNLMRTAATIYCSRFCSSLPNNAVSLYGSLIGHIRYNFPAHLSKRSLLNATRNPILSTLTSFNQTRLVSKSSKKWLDRQSRDTHSKLAKSSNYRSRAAFKLIEIDRKHRIFNKKSRNIVDLGFAPGAWTQVAIERMNKFSSSPKILGVDLIACSPPEGAHFIQGDILSKKTHNEIRDFFDGTTDNDVSSSLSLPVDLVRSDMMANTSGIKDNDHFASMELCDGAIILSCNLLRAGGSLVMKFYTGKEDQLLLEKMTRMFDKVFRMKPEACRGELREMYMIGVKRKDNITVKDVFI